MTPNGTANGAAIKALREARGLNLRECAAEAGIAHGYLSEIERGVKQPRPSVVKRIATALAVPLDAITGKDVAVTTAAVDPDADEDLRLYKPEQVSELWGISKSWIQKAAASGSIDCTYLDLQGTGKGVLRLSRAQIKKILNSSARAAA